MLSLLDGKSGNAHTASARKSRQNASGRESGRRRRSSQRPSWNGKDRVKVRQGRPQRTEEQQANQGRQMTEGVMRPCSPAERGTSCNRLCCASTGAPWNGYAYPLACNLEVSRSNWKAQCGESRMLRLDGGKGRETLPIRTTCKTLSERTLVLTFRLKNALRSMIKAA